MAISKKNIRRGVRIKPDAVALEGKEGEIKVSSSSNKIEAYLGAASRSIVTEDQSATLTNKTVVVANNTITTAASGNLTSVELNAALAELQSDIDTKASDAALQAHINDATDAHDASAISNVPAGSISATDVQAAINELDGDIQSHITDAVDAHDASAISVVPTGNLAADDVQEGLVELQGDIDTINTTSLPAKVTGPASATDEALVRFDLTTGKLVQNSLITATDAGVVSGATQLNVDNLRLDGNAVSSTDSNGNLDLTPNGTGVINSNKDARFFQDIGFQITADNATGGNATLTAPPTKVIRLTNASLTSIDMIPAGSEGQEITLVNATGVTISINNNTGATAANRILTGTGTSATLNDEASFDFVYDSTETRWMLKGAAASGSASSELNSYKIANLGIAATVAASALTIAIKTDSGSDATAGDKISVGFRSATAGTGQFTTVDITAALSTVISSGSTAGQANGEACYIYVYLINNSGTAEVAWSRVAFDEGSLISTTAEGGAGAADSASTIYSTTARTNVPFRIVGRLLNTQTTAGTWATAPSEIALVPFEERTIGCSYTTAAGQAITASAGTTIIYGTKEYDTNNAYDTSTGLYTVPETGKYLMCGYIRTAAISAASGTTIGLVAQNNTTSQIRVGPLDTSFSTTSRLFVGQISAEVSAVKGEILRFRLTGDPALTGNLETNSATNFMSIRKVGF